MTNGTTMLLNDPAFAMQRLTTSYTFSTGYTAQLLRVAPTLSFDIARALREVRTPPPVPVNEVDMGSGPVTQENPLDPAYQMAVATYENELARDASRLFVDALIEDGILLNNPPSIADMEQALHRREMTLRLVTGNETATLSGATIKARFVRHIVAAGNELDEALGIVVGRSAPTEAKVAAHVAAFPDDVQGEAD